MALTTKFTENQIGSHFMVGTVCPGVPKPWYSIATITDLTGPN